MLVVTGAYLMLVVVATRLLLRCIQKTIKTHKIMSARNATEPITMPTIFTVVRPIICPIVRLLVVRSHDHRV